MKTPETTAFSLSKVKLIKDGGLDTHFEVKETLSSEIYLEKYHNETGKDVHPDLKKCFDMLKPIMGRIYHHNFFKTLLETPDFKATPLQKTLADNAFQEVMQKINVTGLSFSGSDENLGCVITGTFTADSNQKMAINSHRIKFTDTRYGFEEELQAICSDLEHEVYEFLFNNKRAQLELFGEEHFDGKKAASGENNEQD